MSETRPCSWNSLRHQVRAKNPRSSFLGSSSTTKAPGSFVSVKITSSPLPAWRRLPPSGSVRVHALPPEESIVDLPRLHEILDLFETRERPELEHFPRKVHSLEKFAEVGRALQGVPSTSEAWKLGLDLVEGDAVTAGIAAVVPEAHLASRKHLGNDSGDFLDPVVLLAVPDVEDLVVDRIPGGFDRTRDCIAKVQYMGEGAPGGPVARHANLLRGPSQSSKVVEDEVEPHPRRRPIGRRVSKERWREVAVGDRKRTQMKSRHGD